jgi:hypothetical protein
MKKISTVIIGLILSLSIFSQAEEIKADGYRSYYVILITQKGEVRNIFKEGKGIIASINDKKVTGTWYFKAEPDLVTIVDRKGKVVGDVNLNNQKSIKLETDEPKQNGGGISIGIGIGPVGLSTGNGGGPRYISYNMIKNKVVFDKQKETREDKIRREYAEKKILEEQRKEREKQKKKAEKKKK